MEYYVLQGGEWVLNFKNQSTDMPKQCSFFISFKKEPTIERLKEIFLDLYKKEKRVKWNDEINNENAVELCSVIKSKSKIEPVEL